VKLYLDEDISPKIAVLLRKMNVDAISAHEKDMIGASDEDQFLTAISEKRVMVTRNRNDYIALTVRFFEDMKPHYGLLIVSHTIPGSDFRLLANLIAAYAKKHKEGVPPYTIEFISRG